MGTDLVFCIRALAVEGSKAMPVSSFFDPGMLTKEGGIESGR